MRDLLAASVSVVIPVYNREALILAAIESVLEQTEPPLEIIVVDDGSTDETAAVVRSVQDQRVTLIQQPNRGVSAARNAGLRVGQGHFVAFLDSDDRVHPEWLETLTDLAQSNQASAVFCGFERSDVTVGMHEERYPFDESGSIRTKYLSGAFMVERELVNELGGFDELLRYSENHELGMRINKRCAELGLRQAATPQILLTMNRETSGGSNRWKLDAIRRILAVHGVDISSDRRRHGRWLGLAAVEAARHGQHRQSASYAIQSLFRVPDNPRAWVRCLVALLPPLARWRWGPYFTD